MTSRKGAETPVRSSLSPSENLAVGAFGGALETCIQMPILTYKFCAQEGRALPKSISGWYRGVALQASTVAPITAIQFMVNGILQNMALRGENRKLTDTETIYTAAGAGAISAIIYSPVDLVTIQQQKMALNPTRTVQALVSNYGFFGLFRGFTSCAAREAVYTAGYLGLAPVLTSHLSENVELFQDKPLTAAFTGACISGTLSALLTHPVDTAKTCVQSDMSGKTWPSAGAAFSGLLKDGGVKSLFNGFVPRTVRLCGAFFVCMSIRELAVDYKTKWENEDEANTVFLRNSFVTPSATDNSNFGVPQNHT